MNIKVLLIPIGRKVVALCHAGSRVRLNGIFMPTAHLIHICGYKNALSKLRVYERDVVPGKEINDHDHKIGAERIRMNWKQTSFEMSSRTNEEVQGVRVGSVMPA